MICDASFHCGGNSQRLVNPAEIVVHEVERNRPIVIIGFLLKALVSRVKRRGRRPIDIEARRRHNRLRKAVEETLREHDEETFKELIIHEIGLILGSPEYDRAFKEWRIASRGKL